MRLSLGNGETFHGEGIPGVTRALLQSGAGYAGGYQAAPVSHLIGVSGDAKVLLHELDIYFENNACEAGGAAVNNALRAVTWKSTTGTNVLPMRFPTLIRQW
jgi:indolepyruvate ferredoxin oxidoreductase alpha subunit